MHRWVIVLLAVCLSLSLALNAFLSATYPVAAQPEPKIVYVEVQATPGQQRTGHAGLFMRYSPTGDELNYQAFWVQGEHWVSVDGQPALCNNRLDARSAWLALLDWQQAQVAGICEVTK